MEFNKKRSNLKKKAKPLINAYLHFFCHRCNKKKQSQASVFYDVKKDKMIKRKLELTDEQKSPLFRIMWIHNANEPTRRQFDNNICAFHIGNGFILSVAHNLRTEANAFKSITETSFQTDIISKIDPTLIALFNSSYLLDSATNKRYITHINETDAQKIINELKRINYDTRWITLDQKNICKPHLIVQFKNNQFYNDPLLTAHFNANTYLAEPAVNRHTYFIEVELVEAFYNEDIALYKIANSNKDIIKRLPSIEVDYTIFDDDKLNYFCLQSSPSSEVGKLLNKAQIEGFIDHFGIFLDRIGDNYTFEGIRYLIKGYFRFGSSGAPYVFYDSETDRFKVNAIQSEACPIQLSIDNKRDGNFQYVNAIASPLNIIETRLKAHLTPRKD